MTYFSATLYMNRLYQEGNPKIATAGLAGDVWDVITSYVGGHWDGKKPLASVFSFLGPGLIVSLGFPWLAIAYEVASALGFDWIGFWNSMINGVIGLVKGLIGGSEKPTEEDAHKSVEDLVSKNLEANIDTSKVDEQKLAELAQTSGGVSLPKAAGGERIGKIIKQAGLFGAAAKSRGLLSVIFKKVLPWVITRALVALGFAVVGGAVRGLVGKKTSPAEEDAGEDSPIYQLKVSPDVSPDLLEYNGNGPGAVWLEQGSISSIPEYLSGWIFNAFPQLQNEKSQIEHSAGFNQVVKMFNDRNKLANGLNIYSVPKPFQKKIDIVSYIVNSYLKTKGTTK